MSEATSIDRIRSGRSWDEFCDALKAAGKVVLSDAAPDDMLNRSEGFRYLSRLTRAGLEAFIEYADPLAPELHRPIHETVKIGADNPDNYYQNAQISGAYEYRIVGLRNTIHYLDFATQTAGVASTGDSQQSGSAARSDRRRFPPSSSTKGSRRLWGWWPDARISLPAGRRAFRHTRTSFQGSTTRFPWAPGAIRTSATTTATGSSVPRKPS